MGIVCGDVAEKSSTGFNNGAPVFFDISVHQQPCNITSYTVGCIWFSIREGRGVEKTLASSESSLPPIPNSAPPLPPPPTEIINHLFTTKLSACISQIPPEVPLLIVAIMNNRPENMNDVYFHTC